MSGEWVFVFLFLIGFIIYKSKIKKSENKKIKKFSNTAHIGSYCSQGWIEGC